MYYRKIIKHQLLSPLMGRARGEKLPTNYVKISILLFLTDVSKTTSEIRDFLKELVEITERRNVQKHLSELYDEKIVIKVVKPGIGSDYQWNNTLDAFKKIVDLISNNSEIVKEIQDKRMKKMETTYAQITQFHRDTLTTPVKKPFDPTRLWYYTNYAVSFFNEKNLTALINLAYKKYLAKKPKEPLNLEQFQTIVLESIDNESLVILMHYSPNLVRYLLNIDKNYENKLANLKKRTQLINFIVLNDVLVGNYPNHSNDFTFMSDFNLTKEYDGGKKVPHTLKLEVSCSFPAPKPKMINHGVQLKL